MLIKISHVCVPCWESCPWLGILSLALADEGNVSGKALQSCHTRYTNRSPASCRNYYFDATSKEEDLRPHNSQSEQIKVKGGGAKNYLLQAMEWLWGAARTPSGPHALGHADSPSQARAVSSSSAARTGWCAIPMCCDGEGARGPSLHSRHCRAHLAFNGCSAHSSHPVNFKEIFFAVPW